jgi:tape measure domain-containing protein
VENVLINFQSQIDGINKAISTLEKLRLEDRKLADEFVKTSQKSKQATDQINKNLGGVNNTLKNIAGAVGIAFGTAAIIQFGKEAINLKAKMESLQNTLNFAFGSAEKGAEAFEFIRALSNKLGLELISTADAFKKFSASANLSGISADQTKKIFGQISTAVTAMGLSADEANGVFLALSQILSKGTVQAEELRGQIGERITGAFEIAAKSMGVTTMQLNKMLEQGQVLSKDFLPKFANEIESTFGGAIPAASDSTQAALNRLSNAFTNVKLAAGKLAADTGIIEFLTRISESFADIGKSNEQIFKEIGSERAIDIISRLQDTAKATGQTFDEVANVALSQTQASLEGLKKSIPELEKELASLHDSQAMIQTEEQKELQQTITDNKIRISQREQELKIINDEIKSRKEAAEKEKALASELADIRKLSTERLEELSKQGVKAAKDELEFRKKALKEEEQALKQLEDLKIKNITNERERLIAQAELEISNLKGTEETKAKLTAEIRKKLNNELLALYREDEKNREEARTGAFGSLEKKLESENEAIIKAGRELIKQQAKDAEEQDDKDRDKEEDFTDFKKQLQIDLANSLFDLTSAFTERELALQKEKLEKGVITENQYVSEVKKIKRQQAINDKAQSLFNIGIHTAENIVKAFPNVVLQALAASLGVLQAGFVLARPIPFIKGTKSVPGIDRGYDSIPAILRPGEKVFTTERSRQYGPILDAIFDAKISAPVLNRMAKGESPLDEYSIKRGFSAAIKDGIYIKNMPEQKEGISLAEYELMRRRGL